MVYTTLLCNWPSSSIFYKLSVHYYLYLAITHLWRERHSPSNPLNLRMICTLKLITGSKLLYPWKFPLFSNHLEKEKYLKRNCNPFDHHVKFYLILLELDGLIWIFFVVETNIIYGIFVLLAIIEVH